MTSTSSPFTTAHPTQYLTAELTPQPTVGDRLGAIAADLIAPVRADPSPAQRRILLARTLTAIGGAAATVVQVIVWLLIAVVSGHLDGPWWLFTAVAAAIAVGVLTLLERPRPSPDAD